MRYNPAIFTKSEALLLDLDTLDHSIERGDVIVASRIITRLNEESPAILFEHHTRIDAAKHWLEKAEAHERIHGAESMLNREHPFNRDILPKLLEWQMKNAKKVSAS